LTQAVAELCFDQVGSGEVLYLSIGVAVERTADSATRISNTRGSVSAAEAIGISPIDGAVANVHLEIRVAPAKPVGSSLRKRGGRGGSSAPYNNADRDCDARRDTPAVPVSMMRAGAGGPFSEILIIKAKRQCLIGVRSEDTVEQPGGAGEIEQWLVVPVRQIPGRTTRKDIEMAKVMRHLREGIT